MNEKKSWIVSVVNSTVCYIETMKFVGTIEEAKRMIFGLVRKDHNSLTGWCGGTEWACEVEEDKNPLTGEVNALDGVGNFLGDFESYSIHYQARLMDSIKDAPVYCK